MSNLMSSQQSIVLEEDNQFNQINTNKYNNAKSEKLLSKAMEDINKVRKQHIRKENNHAELSVN